MLRSARSWKLPAVQAPRFEVDPLWPKPLPNHWVMGTVIGVSVDANDHIWIIHRAGLARSEGTVRDDDAEECGVLRACAARAGVQRGGRSDRALGRPGAGYDWPSSNHGITVDYKGNVWIGGNGRGPAAGGTLPAG